MRLNCINKYFMKLMCLAQGHNIATLVGIEPRTHDLASDALVKAITLPYDQIGKQITDHRVSQIMAPRL